MTSTERTDVEFSERARQANFDDLLKSLQLRVYSEITPPPDDSGDQPAQNKIEDRVADIPDRFIMSAISKRIPTINNDEFASATQTMEAVTDALFEAGETVESSYFSGLTKLHFEVGKRQGLEAIEGQISDTANVERQLKRIPLGVLLNSIAHQAREYASQLSDPPILGRVHELEGVAPEVSLAELWQRIPDISRDGFKLASEVVRDATSMVGGTDLPIRSEYFRESARLHLEMGRRQGMELRPTT